MRWFSYTWLVPLLLLPGQLLATPPPDSTNPLARLRIGVGYSLLGYSGDLSAHQPLQPPQPGAHFSVELASIHRVVPQFKVGFGSLQAESPNLPLSKGRQPNTYVHTSLFTAQVLLKLMLLRQGRVLPYAGVGLGLVSFQPKDAQGNLLAGNSNTRAPGETYGNTAALFPLAIGAVGTLNATLAFGLEYSYVPSTTPYLDNIGQLGKGGNDALQALQLTLYISPWHNGPGVTAR